MREVGSFGPCAQQRSLTVRFEIRRRSLPLAAEKQTVVSSQCSVHQQIPQLQFVLEKISVHVLT
jgi:hypothetical protein